MSAISDLLVVARIQRTALTNAIHDECESPTAGRDAKSLQANGGPTQDTAVSYSATAFVRALDWAEFRTNRFEFLHSAATKEARAEGIVDHFGPMLDELKAAHHALVQGAKDAVEAGQKRIPVALQTRWLEAFIALVPWALKTKQEPSVPARISLIKSRRQREIDGRAALSSSTH